MESGVSREEAEARESFEYGTLANGRWEGRGGVFKHGTSPLAKVLLQSREINKYSCPGDILHSSFACDALADGRSRPKSADINGA